MNQDRVTVAKKTLGWLDDTDGPTLNRYALGCQGPFVELGSFAGKSTVWIGDAADQLNTVVFAVDWHRGSPEMAVGSECHVPEAMDPTTGRHDTLRLFRATIEAADLEDVVIPVVGTTDTVGAYWTTPIGFLFIDACHDGPVMTDYETWAPHIRPGGVLAFHDVTIATIAGAVDRAIGDGFEFVDLIASLAILRR